MIVNTFEISSTAKYMDLGTRVRNWEMEIYSTCTV